MNLTLPVYNDPGVRELTGSLAPFVRPDDALMLVSGNVDKPLELGWLERSLAASKDTFPNTPVLAATAGLEHAGVLAQSELPVSGIVYIYEPNFANIPEFSWNFGATQDALGRAVDTVRAGGYGAIFKPTGRPLYQPYLFKHGWHYGALAEQVDALFVQTQTYCQKGPEAFAGAVSKLALECSDQLPKTYTQVTVDPAARNGATPDAAAACAQTAQTQGLAGTTLWWSPRYAAEARAFLMLVRGEPS